MTMLINPYVFGVPWTPSQITTALWLDAADASTVTTVSGAVSQWNDKSGNGRNATQSTAARRPLYGTILQNGLNTLEFQSANTLWMLLPDTTNPAGSNATFVACKANNATPSNFIIGRAYYWGSWYLVSTSTGTAARYAVGRNGIDDAQANVTSLSNNTDKIFSAIYNKTNVSLSINGGTSASTAYTQDLVYNSSDLTAIGAAKDTGSNVASPFNGPMYEIIVLHSAPSTDTRQRIEGYLAHKWGLTANLPSDHPYKSAAPLV